MKLLKAMATVAGLTGLSRIAGFIRDVLTAIFLGAGPVADAFIVALKLPNVFRRITAEGAFSVSFLPLYTETMEKEGEERAAAFAGHSFAIMCAVLSVFTVILWLFMPAVIGFVAPGFDIDGSRFALAVEFGRITFPYLVLMSLTALMGGVINAHEKFAPFAAAPVFFNLSLIGALLLSTVWFETAGHALSWGVLAAGIIQFVFLAWCLRRTGYRIAPIKIVIDEKIKRLFKLMLPGVIGAGVMQINLLVDVVLASGLPQGSVSYLYYADRLNQLPLGIVGIAVGTALLPMMSKAFAAGKDKEAQELFGQAFLICLLLALPAATGLFVIGYPIIVTLFEHGAFDNKASIETAKVLAAYALGMPAYICAKVFASAYWAQQDTATPVKVSIVATLCNIMLSLWFIMALGWGVYGLAFATSISGWFQFMALKRGLKDVPAAQLGKSFFVNSVKILVACVVMAAALYAALLQMAGVYHSDEPVLLQISGLAGLVAGGAFVYGAVILLSGAVDRRKVWGYIKR